MKLLKEKELDKISPERRRIAKIFKEHIEMAFAELGTSYTYDLQGKFDKTPIRIEIEVFSKDEIP